MLHRSLLTIFGFSILAPGLLGQSMPPAREASPLHAAISKSGDNGGVRLFMDIPKEGSALKLLLATVKRQLVPAAVAMPADKYGFVPTDGEFHGVRSFGQQVKHIAATNNILAAAALGEDPPVDAGDETGPENVRTKAEILEYLNASFAHLEKATDLLGDTRVVVKATPISPLKGATVTRSALVVEALVHAFDHYGQIVEYLRMNGVVPPASRP